MLSSGNRFPTHRAVYENNSEKTERREKEKRERTVVRTMGRIKQKQCKLGDSWD